VFIHLFTNCSYKVLNMKSSNDYFQLKLVHSTTKTSVRPLIVYVTFCTKTILCNSECWFAANWNGYLLTGSHISQTTDISTSHPSVRHFLTPSSLPEWGSQKFIHWFMECCCSLCTEIVPCNSVVIGVLLQSKLSWQ